MGRKGDERTNSGWRMLRGLLRWMKKGCRKKAGAQIPAVRTVRYKFYIPPLSFQESKWNQNYRSMLPWDLLVVLTIQLCWFCLALPRGSGKTAAVQTSLLQSRNTRVNHHHSVPLSAQKMSQPASVQYLGGNHTQEPYQMSACMLSPN